MIKVYILAGIFGHHERIVRMVEPGMTVQQIVDLCRRDEWRGLRIACSVDGRRIPESEWNGVLEDGAEAVITPAIGAFIVPFIPYIVGAIVAAVSTIYAQQQIKKALRSLKQTERGDSSSPVYSWDGIKTNYGAGFPVPLGYGEHDVGGQVINQAVWLAPGGTEIFQVTLALCEGRIHSIGGVTGGTSGEANDLGSLDAFETGTRVPDNIRVNGIKLDPVTATPGALVSLRMGEIGQSAYPSISNTGIVLAVGAELNTQGATTLVPITDENSIRTLSLLLSFPGGLYKQGPSGNPEKESVSFDWHYRLGPATEPPIWITIGQFSVTPAGPVLSPFSHEARATFGLVQQGPLTIRVRRTSGGASDTSNSGVTVRQLSYGLDYVFTYPRLATVDIRLASSSRFYGAQPQFKIRGKLKLVRVYCVAGEPAPGLSTYMFDLPESGPYANIWSNAPGRNPAWQLLDFLLARQGLGPWLDTLEIDYQAIRNWADYCDQNLSPGHPRYTCNFVIDKRMPAWEIIQRICETGRATAYVKGNKISVWYQYAAIHGRGENNVPARVRTQLFTSANIASLRIDYLTKRRPTVYDVEFLDEDKEYGRDPISVEDPDAVNLNAQYKLGAEQYRRESIQLFGTTRRSQAIRHALYQHRFNRAVKTQATLKVGPEALAAEMGDVIGVQDWFLRPYAKEGFAGRITSATGTVSTVTLDIPITVVPADDPILIVTQSDGTVKEVGVTNGAGTVLAGDNVTLDDTVDVHRNAVVAFGARDQTVTDYQIVSLTRDSELRHEITAIEWHPEIHTEPSSIGDDTLPEGIDESTDYVTPETARVVGLAASKGLHAGLYDIGWEREPGAPQTTARIFARELGETAWQPLGQSDDCAIEVYLTPGVTYEMLGVRQAKDGTLGVVTGDPQLTYYADEFAPHAPPEPARFVVSVVAEGLLAEWAAIEGEGLVEYEIRVGAGDWPGKPVIYRGNDPFYLWRHPPPGTYFLHLRARGTSGLYSQTWTPIEIDYAGENGAVPIAALDLDELAAATGTLTDVEFAGGVLRLAEGKLRGTYVGPILDAGVVADLFWWAKMDMRQVDEDVPAEQTYSVRSGEAMWRCTTGRDPSPYRPGLDLVTMVADIGDATPDDFPDTWLARGRMGQVGQRVLALLEVDYDTTGAGAWTGYRPVVAERVIAKRARVRVTLARADLTTQVEVTALVRGAYYG